MSYKRPFHGDFLCVIIDNSIAEQLHLTIGLFLADRLCLINDRSVEELPCLTNDPSVSDFLCLINDIPIAEQLYLTIALSLEDRLCLSNVLTMTVPWGNFLVLQMLFRLEFSFSSY